MELMLLRSHMQGLLAESFGRLKISESLLKLLKEIKKVGIYICGHIGKIIV